MIEEAAEDAEQADAEQAALSDAAKAELVSLVNQALKSEQYSRRMEVVSSSQQRHYERGNQNIWLDKSTYIFRPAAEAPGFEMPPYMGVYNIFRPYERSLIAINTQNPPGIVFRAKDLQASTDVAAAKTAESMRHAVDRDVWMKDVQTQAARLFCTDSRVVVWTRVDDDGEVKCTVHGVLETKVPIYTKSMDEWGYCILSREIDIDAAKEKYPDVDDKLAVGNGADGYERIARLGVLGGSRRGSDQDQNLITQHTAWLRPSRFRKGKSTTDELRAAFPDGVRVVVVSDQVCEAEPEKMDGCLSVAHPSPGDGQNRSSLLKDLVDLQDTFNTLVNMIREVMDKGIPATWFNDMVIDKEALSDQVSEPGAMHPAQWSASSPLSDAFWQEAPAQLPGDVISFAQLVMGEMAQFITGALPSLFGGGTPDSETASGQEALRNQAMGGLSPVWAAMQWLFAKIYEQAVRGKARKMQGQQLSIQEQDGTSTTVDPLGVLNGQFACYPDQDSSFPETTAAKRNAFASLAQMLGQLPTGQQTLSLPDNLKLGLTLNGLEDFVIPGADARDKQLREIDQLLKETPIPNLDDPQWQQAAQQAFAAGQPIPPPPMKSSVAVDADFDYHQPEADKVQEWLSSDQRVQQERQGNTQGIQNVRLHGLEHRKAIPPSAPATKPPSFSGKIEDQAPAVQAALLAADGIQVSPDQIEEQQGVNDAKEHGKKVIQ